KHEITEVLYRYCRAIDRLDEELVRSCYHPDGVDEHGSFAGDIDQYIGWVFDLLRKYDSTFHIIGNVLIDLGPDRGSGPDTARSEAYGLAHHRRSNGPP